MRKSLHRDQSGLASLVIAVLIIIVLTTMVIGFIQIIGKEQRRSLDRQLSSQAFYAAESAVNDATSVINSGYTGNKTQCTPLPVSPTNPAELSGTSNILTGNNNVSYPCLLINQQPPTLEYSQVSTSRSTTFPITSATGANYDAVTFSWGDAAGGHKLRSSNVPTNAGFPINSEWNLGALGTGVLRVDIVPFGTGSAPRSSLIASVRTYFLYPTTSISSANVVNYATEPSGAIVSGNCVANTTPNDCSVTIGNINTARSYVRIMSMYNPIKVSVKATAGGAGVNLTGAQALVDATGKANDVLRRIQVRVPHENVDVPDYALASMDTLCKRFAVADIVKDDNSGGAPDPLLTCPPASW